MREIRKVSLESNYGQATRDPSSFGHATFVRVSIVSTRSSGHRKKSHLHGLKSVVGCKSLGHHFIGPTGSGTDKGSGQHRVLNGSI